MNKRFSWKQLGCVFWRIYRCYMCRFKSALTAFFCFAAAAVAFAVLGPRILGLATTRIVSDVMAMADGIASGIDFPYLGRIALILLVLYAGSALCQYMQGRLMTRITNRSTYFIREDISKKLNHLPLSYFENHDHAEILSFVTNDADVIAFSLNQVMTQLINTILALIGITVIMFSMSWLLALVVLAMLPLSLLAAHAVNTASQHRYNAFQASLGHMTAHVADVYLMHDILRSGRGNKEQLAEFDRLNASMYDSAWRAQFVSGSLHPAVSAISSFTYVGICVLGSLLAAAGSLSIGEIQAFIQYVRSFTQPVTQLASTAASVQHILAAASRIFAFLDADDMPMPTGESDAATGGSVAFESVSVHDANGNVLLENISFSVPAGTHVVVAGRHGSGKSLLLKTLAGLYPPTAGRITVDGQDLASFSSQARRQLFSAAFQVPWLETESVAANVAYGRPHASPEQIRSAVQQAQTSDIIEQRTDGYGEQLSERHRNLSQGEAELLQLARGILAQGRIPILDDAMQSVDPLTRHKVLQSVAKSSKTVFIVTGNPTDLHLADYVILLDHGHVAAAGTLTEVEHTAAFREFWGNRQS